MQPGSGGNQREDVEEEEVAWERLPLQKAEGLRDLRGRSQTFYLQWIFAGGLSSCLNGF